MFKTKEQVTKIKKETAEDIKKNTEELKRVFKRLKIQNAMGKLAQTHQLKLIKKQIAKFLTKEKEKKNKEKKL